MGRSSERQNTRPREVPKTKRRKMRVRNEAVCGLYDLFCSGVLSANFYSSAENVAGFPAACHGTAGSVGTVGTNTGFF